MAMGMTRVGDMELGADFEFQQREWTIQRVAWVIMIFIIVAALVGLFGHGPLANASVGGDGAPIVLSYPRFERKLSPTSWELSVAPNTAQNGRIEVWVATSSLDRFKIESMSPEPAETIAAGDRVVYVFQVSDPARAAVIIFQGQFHEWGIAHGRVGLIGGPELSFRQLIYP